MRRIVRGTARFARDYRRSATYTRRTYLHFRSGVLLRDVTILVRELFPRGLRPVQRAVSPHVAATSLPSRQVEQTLMFYA